MNNKTKNFLNGLNEADANSVSQHTEYGIQKIERFTENSTDDEDCFAITDYYIDLAKSILRLLDGKEINRISGDVMGGDAYEFEMPDGQRLFAFEHGIVANAPF